MDSLEEELPEVKKLESAKLRPEEMYFSELVHNGWGQAKAYQKAFSSNASKNSAGVSASRLVKKPIVVSYLQKLASGSVKFSAGSPVLSACLSRDAKRVLLAEIISDEEQDIAARLRALEIDNRMAGHEAPRVTANLTGSLAIADTLLARFAAIGDAKPVEPMPSPAPAEIEPAEAPGLPILNSETPIVAGQVVTLVETDKQ